MTEEERVQRDAYLRDAMTWANAAPKPSLETRIDRLEARLGQMEADARGARAAILQVEQRVVMLAGAIALAGLAALAFKIALAALT